MKLRKTEVFDYKTAKIKFAKELEAFVKQYTERVVPSSEDVDIEFDINLHPHWRRCLNLYIWKELDWPGGEYQWINKDGNNYYRFKARRIQSGHDKEEGHVGSRLLSNVSLEVRGNEKDGGV